MVKYKSKYTGRIVEVKDCDSEVKGLNYDYILQEHREYKHHKITGYCRCIHLLSVLFGYELIDED